jgi:2,3-dihydroxybenzoate decarboxylase
MIKKIALEEHFIAPELTEYWEPTVAGVPNAVADRLRRQLQDFSGPRLEAMDAAGIERAILSLAGPGVQAEPDTAIAVRKARAANDFLAEVIAQRPQRYGGFAHLAMQDANAAADELERCVTQLGFSGAMIDGQTHGRYLDERQYDVFWERAAGLGAPIYLHPADPEATMPVLRDQPKLQRATWEWTVETASHALRLVFAGTFERYPSAKLILGHLGETLPYMLWRFDSRVSVLYGLSEGMKHLPSHYIRNNIVLTTSGMCSAEPLNCAIQAMGEDNVMFSVDYPFESTEIATQFIETVELADGLRDKLCHANATRILGL